MRDHGHLDHQPHVQGQFHGRVNVRDHVRGRGRGRENGRGQDALSTQSASGLLHPEEVGPTMNKGGTKEIQTKANAANDQDKHRIIDSCVSLDSVYLQQHTVLFPGRSTHVEC